GCFDPIRRTVRTKPRIRLLQLLDPSQGSGRGGYGLAPRCEPFRAQFILALVFEPGNQRKFQSRHPEWRLRLAISETEERRTHAGSQRFSRRTAITADRLRRTQSRRRRNLP